MLSSSHTTLENFNGCAHMNLNYYLTSIFQSRTNRCVHNNTCILWENEKPSSLSWYSFYDLIFFFFLVYTPRTVLKTILSCTNHSLSNHYYSLLLLLFLFQSMKELLIGRNFNACGLVFKKWYFHLTFPRRIKYAILCITTLPVYNKLLMWTFYVNYLFELLT